MPVRKKIVETDGQTLDVSSMLDAYEEKPIVLSKEQPHQIEKFVASAKENTSGSGEEPFSDKLKEDLKVSYDAKGVLDVTFGGYGFLRQDYAITPDRDIYVSTSQIRRF